MDGSWKYDPASFWGKIAYFQGLCLLLVSGSVVYVGLSPLPVTVTTRIITFLVGDPYKPSFATVTGRGDNPKFIPLLTTGFKNISGGCPPCPNLQWMIGLRMMGLPGCLLFVFLENSQILGKVCLLQHWLFFFIPMNPSNKNISVILLIYCTVFIYIYTWNLFVPYFGACLSSKTRSHPPIKTRFIWLPGIHKTHGFFVVDLTCIQWDRRSPPGQRLQRCPLALEAWL